MNPPDESPDTVVCDLSIASCGSGAACGARAMPPSSTNADAASANFASMAIHPMAGAPSRRRLGGTKRSARSASGCRPLALVPDRHRHLLRLDLAHQLRHAPGEGRVHLDLEVVHRL